MVVARHDIPAAEIGNVFFIQQGGLVSYMQIENFNEFSRKTVCRHFSMSLSFIISVKSTVFQNIVYKNVGIVFLSVGINSFKLFDNPFLRLNKGLAVAQKEFPRT